MAGVINRTRKEAKAKISKVCLQVCVQVTNYMLSNLNEINYSKDFVGQTNLKEGRV